MSKTFKKFPLILISLLVIFLLFMTWLYPFSTFSIYKSITYSADHNVVKEYGQELDKFKKTNALNVNNNLTTERTQYILHMFEQNWLIYKNTTKMDSQELDSIKFEVKQARNNLLDLAFGETNLQNQSKDYLKAVIEDSYAIEEMVDDIKNGKAESRRTLDKKLHNLQMFFINDFNLFRTFYEISQKA